MAQAWESDDERPAGGAGQGVGFGGDEPPASGGGNGAFGCSCAVVALGLVIGLAITVVALGYSSMCTDDFDSSDCGSAQGAALLPLGVTLVAALLWSWGWVRRDEPWGRTLAWVGAGVVLVPLLLVAALVVG